MNKQQNNKKKVLAGIIQLITIISFIATIYFMFNKENVVLNPIPYAVGIGGVMLLIDYVILTKIFKEEESSQILDNRNVA